MTERVRSLNCRLATDASRRPRLLVSVRSPEEALAAIEGGADILDVKEPTRGSLGMANIEIIAAIARRVAEDRGSAGCSEELVCSEERGDLLSGPVRGRETRAQRIFGAQHSIPEQHIPLSVALGEVIEWRDRADVPALPESVAFAKLGLSHLARCGGWRDEWRRVRERFDQRHPTHLEWVAVAYADAGEAASPPIHDILEAAIATRCAGLLIDTFAKTGLTLTDCCDAAALCELAERCHSAGLFLALAGRLARESLTELSRVPADIL
ncbi:MAG: (5-formylfuran-3-yl)methyl phosphate synthase, partial [Planctomycetota bacterium]